MKKPVIVVIVFRRYQELHNNLVTIKKRALEEYGYEPPIIIVWSEPHTPHTWLVENLDCYVIPRYSVPGEKGQSISFHCSRDINCGLRFVKQHFGEDYYAVVHCCDVAPQDGVFSRIDGCINQGNEAFLVQLPNTVTSKDVWHTNFFAVTMNEDYWPPEIGFNHPDILERCWGNKLKSKAANKYKFEGNLNYKTFTHYHENDDFKSYKEQCVKCNDSMNLITIGTNKWQKLISNMIQQPVKWLRASMATVWKTLCQPIAIKMSIVAITAYLYYRIEKTPSEKWHLPKE